MGREETIGRTTMRSSNMLFLENFKLFDLDISNASLSTCGITTTSLLDVAQEKYLKQNIAWHQHTGYQSEKHLTMFSKDDIFCKSSSVSGRGNQTRAAYCFCMKRKEVKHMLSTISNAAPFLIQHSWSWHNFMHPILDELQLNIGK